VTEVFRGR